ncbi:MAG TPA: alanine racemase, partial [Porticoccaceae bacterium]|nr:alanine racemase [Porticoccaceae bacterium]
MTRPSHALIDLDALRDNYRLADRLSRAGDPGAHTLPVVKANAYGHGAVAVAKALEPLAPALAVASCDEALALREAGIDRPLVLLEGIFSGDEIALCAARDFWPMLGDPSQIDWVLASRPTAPLTVWLKVDTGMHRLGIAPDTVAEQSRRLRASGHVRDAIVAATHFASADELDNPFTTTQIRRLREVAGGLPLSMANSPALLAWPEARARWNRPGFMLYGSSPFETAHPDADQLQAVMTFASRIMALRQLAPGEAVGYGETWRAARPSLIATVPVGYGDGYPRHAANGTPVLVNGRRASLAGRVSMDLITLDVTDCGPVALGDP